MPHKPVLLKEVLQCLDLKPGMVVVDGTVGSGGHSLEIEKIIAPEGKLIALDQDPSAILRSRETLKSLPNVFFYQNNFRNLDNVLDTINIQYVDAVILDVGVSSEQLETSERGFSFEREGPLDMRMNPAIETKALDLVNALSENELEKIFREYGEERSAGRFAKVICQKRISRTIETTSDLADLIEKSVTDLFDSGKSKHREFWFKRHPATRIFQALRIAVNDELGALQEGLPRIWKRIKPGGKLAVITFHSLEDRIVKHQFRNWKQSQEAVILTKKPIGPSSEELTENPRARSAKLRAVEKRHAGTR